MVEQAVRITKIKFHHTGFDDVRKAPELASDLLRRGEAIAATASAAGGEFKAVSSPSRSRARVVVVTADAEAMEAEATERRLTRALDSGRV